MSTQAFCKPARYPPSRALPIAALRLDRDQWRSATSRWICGQEANTGEHLIKASDLRAIFGTGVTQKAPLYLNNSARKNVAIGGFKSHTLKYQTRICGDCNHARTQRYDTAWADLSAYLRSRHPPVRKGRRIDLTRIFSNSVDRAMLEVHLFLVKQFGCQIVEHGIPIATAPFADAILKGVAHPYVRLAFTEGVTYRGRPRAAVTPVKAVLLGQRDRPIIFSVDNDVVRADDQIPCPRNTASPIQLRPLPQSLNLLFDLDEKVGGRISVVVGDVVDDPEEVGARRLTPFKFEHFACGQSRPWLQP